MRPFAAQDRAKINEIDTHIRALADDPNTDEFAAIIDQHEVVAALARGSPINGMGNEGVLRAAKSHPQRLFGSVHVDLRKPLQEGINHANKYVDHGPDNEAWWTKTLVPMGRMQQEADMYFHNNGAGLLGIDRGGHFRGRYFLRCQGVLISFW